MKRLPSSSRLWLLVACGLLGCKDPVDQAAKRRIFSPEDPPKAVASASEKLSPDHLADEPSKARRVLEMSAAEATERLGPHRYTSAVTFDWAGKGRATKLVENRVLIAGRGGVNGDFHGTVENSRDQGLEVIRVEGQVFARNRYGKFRQRSRDRGIAEREREDIRGAVRDLDELFQGRVSLSSEGPGTHEGRPVFRYQVALGAARAEKDPLRLPTASAPRNGVDETTRRRLAFFEHREPKALQGEVWVDAQTATLVKAHLDGRIAMVGDDGEATLHLTLDAAVTAIGTDPALKAPPDFLPDQDKPEGIAATLDRFGIPHGEKRDGGTSDEAPEEETP